MQEYVHFESVKDTLIEDKTTHKINSTYYRFTGDTVRFEPYFVYEEGDTVYRWSFTESRFLRLFIFNADVGDTLILHRPVDDALSGIDSTYRLLVLATDTFNVDGIVLKRYQTEGLDDHRFWGSSHFMDRIGGLDWFVPRAMIFPEAAGPIRCYSDVDLDTTFSLIPCDSLALLVPGIGDLTMNIVSIFPNPTTQELSVTSSVAIQAIEIYDVMGSMRQQIRGENRLSLRINMGESPNGIYYVKVITDNKFITKRFLKSE